MSDLVAWLRAQLDHDEQVAHEATDTFGYDCEGVPREAWAHMALHDPARVLRQVAAHRLSLKQHRRIKAPDVRPRIAGTCWSCQELWPCNMVRHLAAIYSDRPGFDPSWTVEGQ